MSTPVGEKGRLPQGESWQRAINEVNQRIAAGSARRYRIKAHRIEKDWWSYRVIRISSREPGDKPARVKDEPMSAGLIERLSRKLPRCAARSRAAHGGDSKVAWADPYMADEVARFMGGTCLPLRAGGPRHRGALARHEFQEQEEKGVVIRVSDFLDALERAVGTGEEPDGLCADRAPHPGHLHESASLGRFWCTGDPADREPGRSERRARADGAVCGVRPHLPMTPEELAERERVMRAMPITPLGLHWEDLSHEWVQVVEKHEGGDATVRYPDGRKLRVASWILHPRP